MPCPDTVKKATLKLIKLFVYCLKLTCTPSFLVKQGHWFALQTVGSVFLSFSTSTAGLCSFHQPFWSGRSEDTLCSRWGYVSLPCLGGRWRGCSKLLSVCQTVSLFSLDFFFNSSSNKNYSCKKVFKELVVHSPQNYLESFIWCFLPLPGC